MRVPKRVPILELFSSNGGTFRFQRRNFSVPTEEIVSIRVVVQYSPRGDQLLLKQILEFHT